MPHTTGTRYAVVSCHVERPLDDEIWRRFCALQTSRPGVLAVAALLRPPDPAAGEDESAWILRAREAAARGPLGHHTHWTAPDHARPRPASTYLAADRRKGTGARVLDEGKRLRELGLRPTLFCGGGWYTDVEVVEACAELGYVDCTPRAKRPGYLPPNSPWSALEAPARVRLPSGRLLSSIPTTHSLGDLARALLRPGSLPRLIHVYLHDTDLVDRRRRALVHALLPLLGRLARPTDLDSFALDDAPEIEWLEIARGTTQDRGQAEA